MAPVNPSPILPIPTISWPNNLSSIGQCLLHCLAISLLAGAALYFLYSLASFVFSKATYASQQRTWPQTEKKGTLDDIPPQLGPDCKRCVSKMRSLPAAMTAHRCRILISPIFGFINNPWTSGGELESSSYARINQAPKPRLSRPHSKDSRGDEKAIGP